MRKSFVRIREMTARQLEHVQKHPEQADTIGKDIPQGTKLIETDGKVTLALATTQPKKVKELIHPLSTIREDVELISAQQVLGYWFSAEETSGSYVGNAYEKAQSLEDRIYGDEHGNDGIGYDAFMAELKENGWNEENFAFIVNDTGSSLSANYSNEEEFSFSRDEVKPGSWPGVETGPIIDAQGGVSGFYSSLSELEKRMKSEGRDFDQRGWDEVTYIIVHLAPERKDVKYTVIEAKTPVLFHGEPEQREGHALTQYDFINLDMSSGVDEEFQNRRISGFMKEYWRKYSPMALATKAMVSLMDVRDKSLTPDYNRPASKPTPGVIMTQANLIPLQNGVHKPALPSGNVYQTSQYDYQDSWKVSKAGVIDRACEFSDGVILTPHNDAILKDWDNQVLDLLDLWCSLIVNKQVDVEEFYGKAFIVLNESKNFTHRQAFNKEALNEQKLNWNDPSVEKAFVKFLKNIDPATDPWLKFTMLTSFLHEKGFVKQEPGLLFKQFSPTSDGISGDIESTMLKTRNKRMAVPRKTSDKFGTDRRDLFEISVLGSAGTRVAEYVKAAKDLGYWAASQGMHVRTGGGNLGIMGAASKGAKEFMNENPHLKGHSHLSAIQMPRTIQTEGACMLPKELRDSKDKFMSVEENFDARMVSIFRSNVSVAIAPGIGTYQEVVRWLRHKRDGAPHLQNQKLILLNSQQPGSRSSVRLMDPFLAMMPAHVLKNDLVVVNTLDEVKQLVQEAQAEFMAQGYRQAPPAPPALAIA